MGGRNTLTVEDGALTVIPKGMDRVWGCRSRVVVPLSSIAEVRVEPDPHRVRKGWRGPGLQTLRKLSGTFHPAGERHYWNYSGNGPALNIRLDETQHFRQLYLAVDDVEADRSLMADAIAAQAQE